MSTPMPKSVSFEVLTANGPEYRAFEIRKMNVLKSAMVSKEFAAVVLPIVSGLKVGALGADTHSVDSFLKSALTFDVGASVGAVCAALVDIEEAKLEKLLLNLFSTTSAMGVGQHDGTRIPLNTIEVISTVTEYDHGLLVKLALEVAEYCLPFGPRVKALYGAGSKAISGFGKVTESGEPTSKPSETSETSGTT